MCLRLRLFIRREPNGEAVAQGQTIQGWDVALPSRFRMFLATILLFGVGDFAHSMLVLRAAQLLGSTPKAMSIAVGLYDDHNTAHAASSYPIGVIGDRIDAGAFSLPPT